ncbi:hypothetical protein PGTUg99_033782 [Puccinia graminis f. sp. tritici]|uniref:Uncharacterized protein n=1 Tax=Puccinia graminis f. sp. tritici TaxID=56615 RepID=A0A5B0MG50_PUCGR|nr:hypothetical protein PGTUg99_033782 [Puccinia graminis f. sp. tritici]
MVVLLKRMLFCAVLLGIGLARFALSAFNAEAHAAWDYATASSSEMLAGASKNQHMNTPGEASQAQAQLRRLEGKQKHLKHLINSLNTESPWWELSEIKYELEELFNALRPPYLQTISSEFFADEDLPRFEAESQSRGTERRTVTGSFMKALRLDKMSLSARRPTHKSKAGKKEPSSSGGHNQYGELRTDPSIYTDLVDSKPISSSNLLSKTGNIYHTRDRTIKEQMELWNSLEKKLVQLKLSKNDGVAARRAVLYLKFLESLYVMGDYILKYGMGLPPAFIENIRIFEPNTLVNMVEMHVDLLFLTHGKNFFKHHDSVVPQLGFLEIGPAVYHFHRPIRALSEKHQKLVVFSVLKKIMFHAPGNLPHDGGLLSEHFASIRQRFLDVNFLEEAEVLCSLLNNAPHANHLTEMADFRIADLIAQLIRLFQHPPIKSPPGQRTIEFQLVFYTLDFVDKYYRSIMTSISERMRNPSLFLKQLEFMRSWLAFRRSPAYYPTRGLREKPFVQMPTGQHDMLQYLLQSWIKQSTFELFHIDWFSDQAPAVNLWMGPI